MPPAASQIAAGRGLSPARWLRTGVIERAPWPLRCETSNTPRPETLRNFSQSHIPIQVHAVPCHRHGLQIVH